MFYGYVGKKKGYARCAPSPALNGVKLTPKSRGYCTALTHLFLGHFPGVKSLQLIGRCPLYINVGCTVINEGACKK